MRRPYQKGGSKAEKLLLSLLLIPLLFSNMLTVSYAFAFRTLEIGKKVPDIRLKDAEGADFTLSSLKGKKVVLLFWWAETEEKERRSLLILNRMEELSRRAKGHGIEFVSVIVDPDSREKARALKKQNGWSHHLLVDDKREVYGAYGLFVLPVVAILDEEHRIIKALPFTHSLADDMEGEVLVAMGEKTQAELEKERRPEVDPAAEEKNKARSHLNLGTNFLQKGSDDKAKEEFAKAVELDSGCGEAYVGIGSVLLNEKKPKEAMEYFQKGLKLDPLSRRGQIGAALAMEAMGETEKAIKELQGLAEHKSDKAEVHYYLGRLYEKEGRKDQAMLEYKKALQTVFKAE